MLKSRSILLISLLVISTNIYSAAKITQDTDDLGAIHKILLDYIKNNDHEAVKTLLNKKVSVTVPYGQYSINLSKFVINSSLAPKLSADGDNPLHNAAYYNSLESAKLLLANRANIDEVDGDLHTPLHIAVSKDNADIVKLFLESKANIELKNRLGFTPLHIAASFNAIESTKLLFAHKAIINVIDNNKRTPLHIAAARNNIEIVKLLLDNGADIDAKGKADNTSLHSAIESNALDSAKLLIERGANINATDSQLRTALHIAVQKNNIKAVKLLLDNRPNIEAKNKFENRPLHIAVINNALPVLELLLSAGALIDEPGQDSYTPLQIAFHLNHIKAFKKLLKNKANVTLLVNNKDYIEAANREKKKAIESIIRIHDMSPRYKLELIMASLGIKYGQIYIKKPDIGKLKSLMKVCPLEIECDEESEETLMHFLFSSNPNSVSQEVIGHILAVNSHLLTMPNKKGITPIDMAVRASTTNLGLLALLFKIAYGNSYNHQMVEKAQRDNKIINTKSDIVSRLLIANSSYEGSHNKKQRT